MSEYYKKVKEKNKQERILCAAIWYKDLKLKADLPYNRLPNNCDRGIVFCGYRHPHCMYSMCSVTGLRSVTPEVGEYVQGFLTSNNRFVDRVEAYLIAFAAYQMVDQPYIVGTELYSEDLY